jgi:hypothetical protein
MAITLGKVAFLGPPGNMITECYGHSTRLSNCHGDERCSDFSLPRTKPALGKMFTECPINNTRQKRLYRGLLPKAICRVLETLDKADELIVLCSKLYQ